MMELSTIIEFKNRNKITVQILKQGLRVGEGIEQLFTKNKDVLKQDY
jgi:hypothetical protein